MTLIDLTEMDKQDEDMTVSSMSRKLQSVQNKVFMSLTLKTIIFSKYVWYLGEAILRRIWSNCWWSNTKIAIRKLQKYSHILKCKFRNRTICFTYPNLIVYYSRISDQYLLCCSSVLQTLSTAEKWNCENNENIIRETSNCSHRRWGKWCVNVTGYKIIYINEVTVRLFVCLSVANALPLLNANYWRAQILLSVRNTITFID